jgi:hypothetical protein
MSVALDHGITSLDPVTLPTVDSTSRSFPLGSTVRDGGVNFSIFSRAASGRYCCYGNTYWEPFDFDLPSADNYRDPWSRLIDTYLDSPQDIVSWQMTPSDPGYTYRVGARSMAVLYATTDSVNRDFTT